jgi:hypothetical protein
VSTRSVIARPTPEGSGRGRYCHYDGDPAHQGRVQFDAVTGHFDGDPEAACRSLIDQHPPAGRCWVATLPSHLATGPATTRRSGATQCDCHGGRHEPPRPPLTDHTARAAFMDYAYVLEVDRLRVLTHRPGGWQPVAEPAWTKRPDWDAIDQHAQRLRRGW